MNIGIIAAYTSPNNALTLFVENHQLREHSTPLHRVASNARGKSFEGPVQWRRECGTLYDSPSILYMITTMCVINLCYIEWLLHSSKMIRS
jgi:hypothetical protein